LKNYKKNKFKIQKLTKKWWLKNYRKGTTQTNGLSDTNAKSISAGKLLMKNV